MVGALVGPAHHSTKLPGKRASKKAREKKKKNKGQKRYAERRRIEQLLEEFVRARFDQAEGSVEEEEPFDADILILHPDEFAEEELNPPPGQL